MKPVLCAVTERMRSSVLVGASREMVAKPARLQARSEAGRGCVEGERSWEGSAAHYAPVLEGGGQGERGHRAEHPFRAGGGDLEPDVLQAACMGERVGAG